MPVKKYSISMPEHIVGAMDARANDTGDGRSTIIWRSLARYLAILNRAKAEMREKFSREECALILDSCNGVAFIDTISIQLLPENIVDAIAIDKLDKKWQVDGKALIEKMRTLSYGDKMAVVDAISLWWDKVSRGEQPEYDNLFVIPDHDKSTTMVI